MTVKELYEWAKEYDALDLEIEIQHRDTGGYFRECDDAEPYIGIRENDWNTEFTVKL